MTDLTIVGLGPGGLDSLTLGTLDRLKSAVNLIFRTGKHPVVEHIAEMGISFKTFDHYYEQLECFEDVYSAIARDVLNEAREGPVVFAVPGHPLVGEASVSKILKTAAELGLNYEVLSSMSFLDPLLAGIGGEISNFKLIDGLGLIGDKPDPAAVPEPLVPNVVMQVYNPLVASEVKLSLMKYYPDEHPVKVIKAAGVPGLEKREDILLYELDRQDWVDHLTCVYIPPLEASTTMVSCYPLDPLADLLEQLRDEHGCPWDREQTHESLKKYLVEETYEVVDAIEEGNMYKICEELGDLLLQIAFHAQIAKESGYFDLNDVTKGISEKIIRRHPHVFGNTTINNTEEVNVNWEEIKRRELKEKGEIRESLLDGIPKHLPSLIKAYKIQHKAAKVGFDWPDYTGAFDKVNEEIVEIRDAIATNRKELIRDELGDLLFAAVNLSRALDIDSEEALLQAIQKFKNRFSFMEKLAGQAGVNLKDLSLEQLDKLWEEAKVKLKN